MKFLIKDKGHDVTFGREQLILSELLILILSSSLCLWQYCFNLYEHHVFKLLLFFKHCPAKQERFNEYIQYMELTELKS